MEENQQTQTPTYPSAETVGFPPQSSQPKSRGLLKWIIFLVVGLILIGSAVFFVLRSNSESEAPFPSPENSIDFINTPAPTTLATPQATSTPQSVNKSDVSIEVLNGTGIAGEAAYLEKQLKDMGYTDIKTGNASSTNAATTTVTFNTSLSSTAVSELTAKLESLYQNVDSKTSANTSTFDVRIVIGLRKGATPRASSPAATTSATASPRPTATATP